MGNKQSTSQQTPLRCILDNWKLFDPLALRRCHLKFFCATVWPQYPLGDEEHWPEDGTLHYNTILQLELFCKRQGNGQRSLIQIFFQLRNSVLSMGLLYPLKVSPPGKWCQAQATKKRTPLVKAHLPQLPPSCLVLLPCIQTCPHIREHPLHKSQLEYVP